MDRNRKILSAVIPAHRAAMCPESITIGGCCWSEIELLVRLTRWPVVMDSGFALRAPRTDEGRAVYLISPSLRAKRSNPGSRGEASLDCFVARAPRNDDLEEPGRRLRISGSPEMRACRRGRACGRVRRSDAGSGRPCRG